MRVQPLTGVFGAEITGVDLGEGLDDATFEAGRDAIVGHGVVTVPDQRLTPATQLAFVQRFGGIHYHPHAQGLPEQPEVLELLKTETDTTNFGSGWHSDQMFTAEPASYTCLYDIEIPEAGGDTLFACMRNAYRQLSPGMQRIAEAARGLNLSFAGQLRLKNKSAAEVFSGMRAKDAPAEEDLAEHPIVIRHPVTGEPSLYVGIHTLSLVDFTEAESRLLIDHWMSVLTEHTNTLRVRWKPGTLTLWDNRRVVHNALNDYQGKRRRMHRITVTGESTRAFTAAA